MLVNMFVSYRRLTNDDREEADNVEDEQQAFNERKLLSQSSVEEDCESSDCNDQKSSMPWSLTLQSILLVVEGDQSLDDRSAQESDGADRGLPASKAEPANDV